MSEQLPIIVGISLVIGIVSLCLGAYVLIRFIRIDKKSKLFFSGKDGQGLEELILSNIDEIRAINKDIQELFEISNQINGLAGRGLHRLGIVRFNPFNDIGGDQSFSVAMLDGKNSGFVISSLHSRDGNRVYVKPISQGKSSKYPLTEEETTAIGLAIKSINNQEKH